jgi:hypothetical protein
MSRRIPLSFDLTARQWAGVNEAMLSCFARRSKPNLKDPVNEALAIICREWLAAQRESAGPAKNVSQTDPVS